ncbi:MAG: glycoside hydrolase family 5 protein [Clostridium sp.]|nr:glycoside hydrolase family 5 protein [Clostridium sp.]
MKRIFFGLVLGIMLLFGAGVNASAETAVEKNGALKVSGTTLVSQKTGKAVKLQGVSTHGINWDVGYPYISKSAFQTLRNSYGVNAIRLAMYTQDYDGYCTGAGSASQQEVQKKLKERIDKGVQAATDLGMYVIIDWHVLQDKDPNVYKKQAKTFFKEMSAKYAAYDNVLYEICNEPNSGTTWSEIKKYAKEVIPVIRANDPDAVIIVGTPNWSQDVDIAADSPLSYENVMYAMHFYSATHKSDMRNKLQTALDKKLPVMVTEYGVSEASGNGSIDTKEAGKWLDMLDKNDISYFAWSLSNKAESASLLKAGTKKKSGWKTSDLSKAGKWVFARYQKAAGISNTAAKPKKVSGLTVKNQKGKKIKISYKKVAGATGYEISYSTSKSFAKSKTKTVKTKKTSYTVKKRTKGKTYYIRVRAYKTANGSTVKGSYCTAKKVKIKK